MTWLSIRSWLICIGSWSWHGPERTGIQSWHGSERTGFGRSHGPARSRILRRRHIININRTYSFFAGFFGCIVPVIKLVLGRMFWVQNYLSAA